MCDLDENHLDVAAEGLPRRRPLLRLPQAARAQGRRRGDLRHGGSLAHAGRHRGDAGRQGHLLREAAHPHHCRGSAPRRRPSARPAASCRPGTQQRSSVHFRLAADLVRNGRIGKLKQVEVWLPAGLRQGPFSDGRGAGRASTTTSGRARRPDVPYVKERTHFSFRYWWEYSGGTMTDWGAHHNDIVLWTLGTGRLGAGQRRGQAADRHDPGRLHGGQRVRAEVHLRQRCRAPRAAARRPASGTAA